MAKKGKYTNLIYLAGGLLLAVGGYIGYKKWFANKAVESSDNGGGGGGGGGFMTEKSATAPKGTTVSPIIVSRKPVFKPSTQTITSVKPPAKQTASVTTTKPLSVGIAKPTSPLTTSLNKQR